MKKKLLSTIVVGGLIFGVGGFPPKLDIPDPNFKIHSVKIQKSDESPFKKHLIPRPTDPTIRYR